MKALKRRWLSQGFFIEKSLFPLSCLIHEKQTDGALIEDELHYGSYAQN